MSLAKLCGSCELTISTDSKTCLRCGTLLIPLDGTNVCRSTSPSAFGTIFANTYPNLDLLRDCTDCRVLIHRINTGQLTATEAARHTTNNANRKGLQQFGSDLQTQRQSLADAIGKLDPRTIRTTCNRNDVMIATVHYNPCGYRRLRETYYEWLPTLGPMAKQLQCYELVFDDDKPEIEGSIVIRGTRAANAMWQKEPLLNIALAACDKPYFCWLDHDMVSHSATWITDAIELLDDCYHAVQLFSKLKRLGRNGGVEHHQQGGVANGRGLPGGAWLAETDYLREIGGFPTDAIVGGGDAKMLTRMYGSVTCLPVTCSHLWHGQRANRQHQTRHKILKRHNFDYKHDTKINSDGILEWASKKPNLHREVRQFFERRQEDT